MREDGFQPSQRALAAFNVGQAWDLIQLAHQYPPYDPEQNSDGLINLMGAHSSLMSGWIEKYLETDDKLSSSSAGRSYLNPPRRRALY